MAIVTNKNTLPVTMGVAVYNLLVILLSAGWTVVEASDGTTYPQTLTNGGAGAQGFANSRAWFRVRMGGGATREFTFQWINATDVRIKYSAAGFNAGGANATTTPAGAAGDDNVILGGGSNAAPTGGNLCGTINRVSYWADNAAPYGWGMHGWSAAGANTFGLILDSFVSGSYPAGDQEPYVIWVAANNTSGLYPSNDLYQPSLKCGWYARGTGSAAFMTVGNGPPIQLFYTVNTFGNTVPSSNEPGVNPWTGKDDNLPAIYMRASAPYLGYRGVSNYVQVTSIKRPNLSTQTINPLTPLDRIVLGWASFPWGTDGVAPLA